MFILDMWLWIPTGRSKDRRVFGFCAAEVSCSSAVLVSPRLEEDTRAETWKMVDDESDILVLNENEGMRGEVMESDDEEQVAGVREGEGHLCSRTAQQERTRGA